MILDTKRLVLRKLEASDAEFILRLVNEPAWLRFIGDKGLKTVEAARAHIEKGPVAMYAKMGYGQWLVELKGSAIPIGVCGFLKRDGLEHADLGFAFLSAHHRKGFAFESATATMACRASLGLGKVLAITSPGNEASIRLLEKLGFRFERMARLPGDEHDVNVYARP